MSNPMIKLLNQTSYQREQIKNLLRPILDEQNLFKAPETTRRRVLLKPNFVKTLPRDDASTTHPEFYMAIAELLLERGCEVGIGESPAIGSCAGALRTHGVLDECRERGIHVIEFKQPENYAGVSEEKHYRELTIAHELRDWDAIINLPKLKTHRQFTFTGASKNLYGCVTGKRKFFRHNLCGNDPKRFARMILANAAKANCVLHIGDGIEALHVLGPTGGKNYPLGKIIVSDDYLTHDWLFCRLTNLDPLTTPLFQAAGRAAQDRVDAACREIVESPDFRVTEDFIHAPLIHISFSPWHIARSGWRTVKYNLGWA
jgi:uncharacterized protein (DUF362 family)